MDKIESSATTSFGVFNAVKMGGLNINNVQVSNLLNPAV